MKKSPLKRKTPLKAKLTQLGTTYKNPPRRVSPQQIRRKEELALRRKVKAELIAEFGIRCMTCGSNGRLPRGIELSHIIPLSRGGVTSLENCLLECEVCHDRFEKRPELREKKEG